MPEIIDSPETINITAAEDVVFSTGGVERARIHQDGSASGLLGGTQTVVSTIVTRRAADRSIYTYSSKQSEYDPVSNRTYITFAGPGRCPWITYYDHATGSWGPEVQVSVQYPLGVEDNHGAPSICIDTNGYIHVAWGAHNTAQLYKRTTNPRDITSWTSATTIPVTDPSTGSTKGLSYPHFVCDPATGYLYITGRAGANHVGTGYPRHEFVALIQSTDGGTTWTDIGPIIDLTAYSADAAKDPYISDVLLVNGKIYLAFVVAHGASHDGPRDDVFCLYYDIAGAHMHLADGTDLGTISTGTQGRVYAHGYCHQPKIIRRPSDGALFVVFTEYVDSTHGMGYRVAKFSGGAWTTIDTGIRTNFYAHQAGIRLNEDGHTLEMFVVDGMGRGSIWQKNDVGEYPSQLSAGADLSFYTSTDDATTWTRQARIAYGTQIPPQGVVAVEVPRNSEAGLKAIWQGSLANPEGGSADGVLSIYASTDVTTARLRDAARISETPQSQFERRSFMDLQGSPPLYSARPTTGSFQTIDASGVLPQNARALIISIGITPLSGTGLIRANFRETGTTRRRDAVFTVPIVVTGQPMTGQIIVPVSSDGKFDYLVEYLGGSSPLIDTMQLTVTGYLF